MSSQDPLSLWDIAKGISEYLLENYWGKMWNVVEENPQLKERFTAFLINPEKLIFYFGKHHWAIEYVGAVRKNSFESSLNLEIEVKDYTTSENLIEDIIGIEFEGTGFKIPLFEYNENVFLPTDEAFTILSENGWNFAAQSMYFGFNTSGLTLIPNQFSRLVNSFFYGTDNHGLVVRNIKWLDVFPLEIEDVNESTDQFKIRFWDDLQEKFIHDSLFEFPLPEEFQYEKLVQVNRFIELFSSEKTSETDITRFLEAPENQFILKMAFFGKDIHAEIQCPWQSEPERQSIRPDFFITDPNGLADIIEFKLPNLKGRAVVGRVNRETFSAEIQSYIAQTSVYEEYFEDPSNRKYVKEKHGIDVRYPNRILVLGRRWMFDVYEWKRIQHQYRNITIRTYDDLVDGILSQLYS